MDFNCYIFRNTTVEPLFNGIKSCVFSGYNDSEFPEGFKFYLWFYLLPLKPDIKRVTDEVEFLTTRLEYLAGVIPTTAYLLCFTMEDLFPIRLIESDIRLKSTINKYNRRLNGLAEKHAHIKVINFDDFISNYQKEELIDWRHYYLSQVVINPKLSSDFQNWFFKKINAIQSIRKKCLVLDLDNTLWGGVLGEEGVEGIHLGNIYPGNCYFDLQAFILEMKNKGVILAICSKNNENDVKEAFERRNEMRLKMDDFAAVRINWNDKPENLLEIAEELNIDADSMVFLDDNPAERELMRKMLPDVMVPDFPKKPYLLIEFIIRVYADYFQVYELTGEDKLKTEHYKKKTLRNQELKKVTSKEDFIRQLELQLHIMEADELTIPRIAQMTQKTNQFNLTTKRYTEADIGTLLQNGYRIWCASVKDKFGDHGITALAIIKLDSELAEIDSLLLSCRILGYGIERAFLLSILNKLKDEGIKTVHAQYIPSSKNKQTEEIYEQLGFELVKITGKKIKHYHLTIKSNIKIPNYYHIT